MPLKRPKLSVVRSLYQKVYWYYFGVNYPLQSNLSLIGVYLKAT
jgi:hypothetical protein